MKTTLRTAIFSLIGSLLLASPLTMAASLTDRFDPYVLNNEIETAPVGEIERLADRFDPYVLNHEIVAAKSCSDPIHELIADQYDPFVTLAEFTTARQSKRC